jgi:hypothetical protein
MNRDEILAIYRECGVRFTSRWDGIGTKDEERLIAAASRIESLVREECQNEFKTACKMQINCAAAIRKSEG